MRIITQELIKKFENYLVQEEKAENTVEKYIHDVILFMMWLNCREVSKTVVLEYKKELISKYSPATVNSHLSSLNSFFDFCGWHDCKTKNVKIQKQIFSRTEKELTKTEYERLLQAARSRKNHKVLFNKKVFYSSFIYSIISSTLQSSTKHSASRVLVLIASPCFIR